MMAESSKIFDVNITHSYVASSIDEECRVCVNNTGVLPIFGDDYNPDISGEISRFGEIMIQKNDAYPQYICEECYKLLEAAIEFRKSAKRAEAILKRKRKKGAARKEKQIEINLNIDDVLRNADDNARINFVSVRDSTVESDFSNERFIDDDKSPFKVEDEMDDDNEMLMFVVTDNKPVIAAHCKFCDLNFKTVEEFEEHRNTIEHKRKYIISFLPKNERKKLNNKETVNPKDLKCEICNKMFTKIQYPRHMQNKHKIKMETCRSTKKKECTVCKKMFHPVSLSRHMKQIHGDKNEMQPKTKIECPVCNKKISKDFYRLHMQRHEQGDTKNYICDKCGKKFFFSSTFHTHRLIHTNVLPHKCEYCPYRGRTKGLLKTHVRTHTGDYPYKCTQCETRCLTKSNLNAHMQRHRGPVDFICDTCSRGFYNRLDLQRHITVAHMGIKSHVCDTCGMAFGYRHGLVSHQLSVHKRAKGIGKAKAVYLKLEEEGKIESNHLSK